MKGWALAHPFILLFHFYLKFPIGEIEVKDLSLGNRVFDQPSGKREDDVVLDSPLEGTGAVPFVETYTDQAV